MEAIYFLNKYKKRITTSVIVLLTIILFTSCTSTKVERQWESTTRVRHRLEKLQVGDIIIKNKVFKRPMTWFGHSAMLVDIDTIGDYPRFFATYYEIDTYSWLYEDRDVIVLRYKHFDEKFKKVFLEKAKKYSGDKYFLSSKNNTKTFYCSKYVWKVYLETAKELGYDLDLDSDGGLLVLPYDIMHSKDLEQIFL